MYLFIITSCNYSQDVVNVLYTSSFRTGSKCTQWTVKHQSIIRHRTLMRKDLGIAVLCGVVRAAMSTG